MTVKQKKAAKIMAENGGNVSRAMIEAGYSPMTAKTPQKLTEALGFKQLLQDFGPDIKKAFKTTNDLMEANNENDYPNWNARAKGVELTFKAHGIGDDAQVRIGDNITVNIQTYGDTDNFRTPGLATTFRDNPEQSPLQDPQLAPKSS